MEEKEEEEVVEMLLTFDEKSQRKENEKRKKELTKIFIWDSIWKGPWNIIGLSLQPSSS